MASASVQFTMGSEQATVVLPVYLPSQVDETAVLQAIIDAAPDGTAANPNVVDLDDRIFRVDGQIRVGSSTYLAIENGKIDGTRHAGAVNSSHFLVAWPSNHIIVRNIEVEGAHTLAGAANGFPAWEGPNGEDWHGHHGFAEAGAMFVHYETCKVNHVYGDGFYTGWHDTGPTNIPSEDISHNNCQVDKTGRQGAALTAAKRWSWTGGSVKEVRVWAFDLEPGPIDSSIEDITIDGVDCTGAHRLGVMACGGGGAVGRYRNVQLSNTTTDQQAVASWPVVYATTPVGIPERDGLTVTGNTFIHHHLGRPWFEATRWTGVVSTPNTVNGVLV